MTQRAYRFSVLGLALLGITLLTACWRTDPYMREEVAMRLASPSWMNPRVVPSDPFALKAFERVHNRFGPANLYIAGDGFDGNFNLDAADPTPVNPVALHLASHDKAENVIYLARPFQYRFELETGEKEGIYWQEKRFSREVLDSFNSAMDEIKRRWNITGFNLIGYNGGGAIAALLAAQRNDIMSFRTVAGNLDHSVYTRIHEMAPLEGSLNPASIAPQLADVPQCHYIGGQDAIVPPAILHSYLQAMGPTNCVSYDFIQEAAHDEGWVDKWPGLLAQSCSCRGPVMESDFEPILPEPIYTTREIGKGMK